MNNNAIRPRVIKKLCLKLLDCLIYNPLNLNQTIKNIIGKPHIITSQREVNHKMPRKLCIFANIPSPKQTRVLRRVIQESEDFLFKCYLTC